MAETEIWKPIAGYEGLYDVSNMGHVRSIRAGKILRPRKMPTGYLRVNLPSKVGKRDHYIHRLVAETFCEHPLGCDVVNHLDNDVTNNEASNLEWVTQRDNVFHAMNQGRVLNFPNAKPVIGIKDGIVQRFRSANEAAQHVGCDSKSISNCCRHIKHTTHGYRWEFAEVIG